ncbi:DEP domain-containing protein 1B-like isoform X2 [Daphnia carinata]|uniref:DEP domain-containing protein 1B-like isoform X2 n=1 Tax=Daphnia carinata TaxID=120202 RepID=UPI00257E9EF6|nr:DEP domain-containing protein 1B-like isoform X2 [Daphnia carinata]
METPKPITGPYRATRLWNEALRIFNNGVPQKRHWRQLKQYDNCFTATEATNWLHSQLKENSHFGPSVSKEQTQQLLSKFLKAGVFEDVRGVGSKADLRMETNGLYRLTNRSPFRNPRTPGRRTPLATLANRNNCTEYHSSPKLAQAKKDVPMTNCAPPTTKPQTSTYAKTLVQCQLTAKQLNHHEVEELWKNTALRQVAKILNLTNLNGFLDPNEIKGKWVLWNVSHVGLRGVVQPMEDSDSPPSWVLYGMKSLVNWPSNENHKLPEYQGSEKDVFKVICDYFTNASTPLSTFYLYNILVEAFIRSEAADLTFRKPNEPSDDREDDAFSLHSRDSARGLVLEMASPIHRKTSTPIGTFLPEHQDRPLHHQTLPVAKSPLACNRNRSQRMANDTQRNYQMPSVRKCMDDFIAMNRETGGGRNMFVRHVTSVSRRLHRVPSNACYETAFTTAEPMTRIVTSAGRTSISRVNESPDQICNGDRGGTLNSYEYRRQHHSENPSMYHSLDRLRSKSGGYVNVAAFGSLDRLDRSNSDRFSGIENDSWMACNATVMHSRSVSSLSCHQTMATGLSPSFSDTSIGTTTTHHNYENLYHVSEEQDKSHGLSGQLRIYRNSPSKRLIGRRKGLVTAGGKAMAIELLQLLTLLLPPDRRRKLHLLLRFMAKVSANQKLVLDPEIQMKTLMVNTFYRCIICSSEEADYDELLAVRLVSFLMENSEAIMTVPYKLCSQVRDLLGDIQREKIRFQLDDVVPLTYCVQVSPQRFEEQRRDESKKEIYQLLEHIVNNQNMPLKEKRKRLKQFQVAYPEIYASKFPTEADVLKLERPQSNGKRPSNPSRVLSRIRNLRLN